MSAREKKYDFSHNPVSVLSTTEVCLQGTITEAKQTQTCP